MKREHLNHIVRASADITGETAFVIVGSQSILGSRDDIPLEMLVSMEADIYPRHAPEKADQIDGAIGEGSAFQETFGYYAHGVGPATAKCPKGWEDRLVTQLVNTTDGDTVVAECLEIHDLILSKCVAGRDRDWEFVEVAIRSQLVNVKVLCQRVPDLPVSADEIERVRAMLEGIVARSERNQRPSS